jgi:hypothetical protein
MPPASLFLLGCLPVFLQVHPSPAGVCARLPVLDAFSRAPQWGVRVEGPGKPSVWGSCPQIWGSCLSLPAPRYGWCCSKSPQPACPGCFFQGTLKGRYGGLAPRYGGRVRRCCLPKPPHGGVSFLFRSSRTIPPLGTCSRQDGRVRSAASRLSYGAESRRFFVAASRSSPQAGLPGRMDCFHRLGATPLSRQPPHAKGVSTDSTPPGSSRRLVQWKDAFELTFGTFLKRMPASCRIQ